MKFGLCKIVFMATKYFNDNRPGTASFFEKYKSEIILTVLLIATFTCLVITIYAI